jgi:hypothetical protein
MFVLTEKLEDRESLPMFGLLAETIKRQTFACQGAVIVSEDQPFFGCGSTTDD